MSDVTRKVQTEKFGEVVLRFPTPEETRRADWQYSKIFNEAILDGIPTQKQMEDLLREKGIWTNKDDKELDCLKAELDNTHAQLSEKKNGRKKSKELKLKISKIRQELIEKQSQKQRYLSNTVEMKADEARLNYLIHTCVETEAGEKIWNTYSDFQNERDHESTTKIIYEFLTFINNIDLEKLAADMFENETEEEIKKEESVIEDNTDDPNEQTAV